MVASRSTPEVVGVLVVGSEEIGRFCQEMPPEKRQGVINEHP